MAKISTTQKLVAVKKIVANPDNPRTIKDHKFKQLVQSIKDFPEMLEYRNIVVDENMMILGGNMRWKACIEAGLQKVRITIVEGLSEAQKKEFIIKDNANYGVWDWDELANNWNDEALSSWGLNIWKPSIENHFTEAPEGDEPEAIDDEGISKEDGGKERKKVIPIEFSIEDYDTAATIYNNMRKQGVNIAAEFTQKLSEELCK